MATRTMSEWQTGIAEVVSTDDEEEVRQLEWICDRLAIMHRGKILAHGTLDNFAEKYGNVELEELFYDLLSDRIKTTPV